MARISGLYSLFQIAINFYFEGKLVKNKNFNFQHSKYTLWGIHW